MQRRVANRSHTYKTCREEKGERLRLIIIILTTVIKCQRCKVCVTRGAYNPWVSALNYTSALVGRIAIKMHHKIFGNGPLWWRLAIAVPFPSKVMRRFRCRCRRLFLFEATAFRIRRCVGFRQFNYELFSIEIWWRFYHLFSS